VRSPPDSGQRSVEGLVLRGDDLGVQSARLKLAAAARQVLASALDLVGVLAPDAM